jgi:hypothetical protein
MGYAEKGMNGWENGFAEDVENHQTYIIKILPKENKYAN